MMGREGRKSNWRGRNSNGVGVGHRLALNANSKWARLQPYLEDLSKGESYVDWGGLGLRIVGAGARADLCLALLKSSVLSCCVARTEKDAV